MRKILNLATILFACSLLNINVHAQSVNRQSGSNIGVGVNAPTVGQSSLEQPSVGGGMKNGNSILNRKTTPIRSGRYVSPTQQNGSTGGTTIFNYKQSSGRLSGGSSGGGGGSMSGGMGIGGSSRGGGSGISSGNGGSVVAVPSLGSTTYDNTNKTQSGPRRVSDDDDPGEPGVDIPLGNGILFLLAVAATFAHKKRKEK